MNIYIFGAGIWGRQLMNIFTKNVTLHKFYYIDNYLQTDCLDGVDVFNFCKVCTFEDTSDKAIFIALSDPDLFINIKKDITNAGIDLISYYNGQFVADGRCNFVSSPFKNTTFGMGCRISDNVKLSKSTSVGSFTRILSEVSLGEDVQVCKYCTINLGAKICSGVFIGEGSFINAGCIITSNVLSGSICI